MDTGYPQDSPHVPWEMEMETKMYLTLCIKKLLCKVDYMAQEHSKNLRVVLIFMATSVAHSINILPVIGVFLYYGHVSVC